MYNNTYMNSHKKHVVEITPQSIVLITLFPLLLYFLWIIKDILFSMLIGFILMSALKPAVNFLTTRRVPRALATLLVYLVFLFVLIYLISLIIPPIITETAGLFRTLPAILDSLNPQLDKLIDVNTATQYVPNVTNRLFDFLQGLFSNTLFVISTLFFGFYLLLEENLIGKFLAKYFDENKAKRISSVISKAEERMSSWFWGELMLMTIVGFITYIGLNIIGIRYALPLAVLAGLLEVVPNIGPIISSIPAILIGFTQSYFVGFSAAALYFIVQQMENNLIVPVVMRRAVGVNPITTLICLLIGGRIGGVLGILLAIPLFLFVETVIGEFIAYKKRLSEQAK